jgi:hypothetical protein
MKIAAFFGTSIINLLILQIVPITIQIPFSYLLSIVPLTLPIGVPLF